ncbi:MAG: isoleucine--tRNA ligase [Metamycoplasmataceae bacterium]
MQKDYKNTLLLPQSEFSMRANLVEKDLHFSNFWKKINLYQNLLVKNKNNPSFILHDGPPYANGDIHIGHAMNKILKDIIVRYKTLNNFYCPYVPGWDTHGLPIENKMLQEGKRSHKDLDPLTLRIEAEKYALEQIEIQKNQFEKLNLLADFKKIYRTLDPSYEVKQLEIFKKLIMTKLIYRGLKPVYWSPSSQSALAEAEVEYHDHRSPSILVSFLIEQGHGNIEKSDNLIIWTTTPWTLLANSGAAIGKEIKYIKFLYNSQKYIVAEELFKKTIEELKWENVSIISLINNDDLINSKYRSPLNNLLCPIVYGHHVSLEVGTGIVHIAPLFGEDDFLIGKKENLEMIMHIADDGTINDSAKMFNGIFYEDANKEIGLFLDEKKNLLSLKFIKHSYPHDWRTNKPIIFRGTPQWFVSIKDIKDKIIKQLDKVNFYNQWGKKRMKLMIENRDEWTISRQRTWGVPLIIFYDENKEPVLIEEVFDYVINLVKDHGTNIWFEKNVDELLPSKYRGKNWTKENDIMDVWFDSGSSFYAVDIDGISTYPYDLYLEGNDQYRGWFNSSLINSVAFENKAPYKGIISHGFVLDQKGNKMSKSKGNVVDPQKIIQKYGSDILRLWVANSEYISDISIGDNILEQNIEIYRKIRNTLKHMLGNIFDYKYKEMTKTGLHLLIEERLNNVKIRVKKYYENYNFISVVKELNSFITDLSAFYLSVTKDILYLEKENNNERRQVQNNLYQIIEFILISLSPIIPTTCEEAYQFFNKENKQPSIHMEQFYKTNKEEIFVEEEKWKEFFILKNQVYKVIEEKIKEGYIKRSNEAVIKAPLKSSFIKSLNLKDLLMIIDIKDDSSISVEKIESFKCIRCWNHFRKEEIKDDLCLRCKNVVLPTAK